MENGELSLKTRWRDFVKSVKEKEDDRYLNMFNATGYDGPAKYLLHPLSLL